jgi:hypothetical protein
MFTDYVCNIYFNNHIIIIYYIVNIYYAIYTYNTCIYLAAEERREWAVRVGSAVELVFSKRTVVKHVHHYMHTHLKKSKNKEKKKKENMGKKSVGSAVELVFGKTRVVKLVHHYMHTQFLKKKWGGGNCGGSMRYTANEES